MSSSSSGGSLSPSRSNSSDSVESVDSLSVVWTGANPGHEVTTSTVSRSEMGIGFSENGLLKRYSFDLFL